MEHQAFHCFVKSGTGQVKYLVLAQQSCRTSDPRPQPRSAAEHLEKANPGVILDSS